VNPDHHPAVVAGDPADLELDPEREVLDRAVERVAVGVDDPGRSVTHSAEPMAAGRSKPETSSLALGLNSTRTVSSRAVWVLGATGL
jgi:hypothetical protein